MFTKLKIFYRSLTVKITIAICCTILPIIIFVLVISNIMMRNMQDKLEASINNELAIYMTQIDAELYSIRQDMKNTISDNWVELATGEKSQTVSIEKYQFWTQLKNYREQLSLVNTGYLKTSWDRKVTTTYNNTRTTYKDDKIVQAYLEKENLGQFRNLTYTMIQIDSKKYIIINQNMYNYSFGFIIDVNDIIAPLENVGTFESEENYLMDMKGNILSTGDNTGISSGEEKLTLKELKEKNLAVTCRSKQMNYMLLRTISNTEFNSAIPFLEKVLRFAAFFSVLIIPVIWLLISQLVLRPLRQLDTAMHEIESENLDYRIGSVEKTADFEHMNHVFNKMAEQIKQLTIETYEKDIEKLQIEATNMRLQVNPHMLLNSLNMIYSLSQSQNYKCIQEFTLCLTEYFRYVLYRNEELVTLKEEMKFVNSYINIQKIRFPDSFVSVFNIDEELFVVKVPPLLIQNFVENSIKYALKLGSEIEIIVTAKKREDKLVITVVDTGNGMEQEILDTLRRGDPVENKIGKHIGILNCRRRLKMYYGEEAVLNISSVRNEGTQIWIGIPLEK